MIDVEKVLLNLDIQLVAQRGEEVQGYCPMHKARTGKEDHNPSWWINGETGAHICFSCGYKGNVYTLVGDLKGIDYFDARDYVNQQADVPLDALMRRIQELPQYIAPSDDEIGMSEARLAVFTAPPVKNLKGRALTPAAAEHHGVLWDAKTLAWILPIRDPDTFELWGWQEKGSTGRFFKNQPAGIKKSKTVFGVEKMATDILVVVESPLDVVRLAVVGVEGAIATCGAIISEDQAKIMRRADKVIAAFDNDDAGKKASEQLRAYARKYGMDLSFFNYDGINAKDPGDMTMEQIHQGIEHSKSAVLGKAAYL